MRRVPGGLGLILLVALLVATPALSGCLGGEEDPEGQPRPPPPDGEDGGDGSDPAPDDDQDAPSEGTRLPAPFLLRASACHSSTVLVSADEQVAAQHLPDGFATMPVAEMMGGPATVPGAALQVLTVRCEEGGVLGTAEGGTSLHLLALVVDVPDAYASQAPLQDLFLVSGIAGEAPVGQAFQARGWSMATSTVSWTRTSTPVGVGLLEAEGQDATNGTTVTGTLAPENVTGEPGFLRLWHAPEERLEYLHLDIGTGHPVSNGTATVATQATEGPTVDLLGPALAGPLELAGPYNILASPVLVERASAS